MQPLINTRAWPLSPVARLIRLMLTALLCAALTPVVVHGETLRGTTVWESADEYVKLAPQDAPRDVQAKPNQHPIALKPDDLAAALTRISFRTGQRQLSLMDSTTATRLAPHLAEALGRASPEQDVVFAVLTWVKADIVGSNDVTVAARAFYSGARLHLVVGDLHRRAVAPEFNRSPVSQRKIDRRLHPHEPGARSRETPHDGLSFQTGPGIQLFEANGRTRQDWLVLDLAGLAQPAAAAKEANERDAVKGDTAAAEERLARLKRLYERGLITADEYARKRKEIIDQL